MAKKVSTYIKLQVPAGQANPSPPVGPALGQHGVNIMEFCKAFNAQTQGTEPGLPIPVIITVYADRSFTFISKTPPAAVLLRKAAGIKKGLDGATLEELVAAMNAGERGILWWSMSVVIIVMIIPVVLMAIVLQRFISKGVLLGAVKG